MDLEYISHYRIVRMIGSGGMGEVYLAEDARLKRQVAIKVLRIESSVDAEKASRFEKEARAASALNHPNILTVFDVGKSDSFRYMVTEFVDGQTLREYFRHGSVPVKKAVEIMTGVAKALDAAHSAGIIHRDVKPENIMIRRDGAVKVLDFGLAKLTPPKDAAHSLVDTTPGLIMGTPKYMSPEQVRGLEVDRTTDVYSLGAVFYEMIAGAPPFDEATVGDTIAAVLTRQPVPLDRQNPETPATIQKIVERCLNKDRESRYRTMTSVIFDLESAIARGLQNENVTRRMRTTSTEQPTALDHIRETGNDVTVRDTEIPLDTDLVPLPGRIRKRPLVVLGVAAVILAGLASGTIWLGSGDSTASTPDSGPRIPVRVIDPLGGEDPESLDDLHASWERSEPELDSATLSEIKSAAPTANELRVSASFFDDRRRKAMEGRPGEKGIRPPGLDVPTELFGDGIAKQKAKLAGMTDAGFRQTWDFADLAEKRLTGELVELPMATRTFYLDVGGSVSDEEFKSFSFEQWDQPVVPGHFKFARLKSLADNFSGERYSLDDPSDRRQMRHRLLRLLRPTARVVLYELAEAYETHFNRPLRIAALTRSVDYQIALDVAATSSFKVTGETSLPPHASGLAFDLSRTHMPVDEQNFVMRKLAEMEQQGRIDGMILYGENACFHVFVYDDGKPPEPST